jgi:hypothetical protein
MKEQVVVAPNFRSFSSHIFSEASQNITVKVRVDSSVRRNKFAMNNAVSSLLLVIVGSSTATIIVLFLDHNRKSNFRHPL